MSLEAAIHELNENILILTKALGARPSTPPVPVVSEKVKHAPIPPVAPPVATTLNYDKDVKPVALKLLGAKNGRDRMIEVLKKHSATTAQALKPEQYAAFIKDLNAEIAK
jgi:hypothetical protein